MLENHEDDILEWFLQHRQEDPMDYLCRKKILQEQNTGQSLIISFYVFLAFKGHVESSGI